MRQTNQVSAHNVTKAHIFHNCFFFAVQTKTTVKKVLLGSAITIKVIQHAPEGEKGESKWQQMTCNSQLLNNV